MRKFYTCFSLLAGFCFSSFGLLAQPIDAGSVDSVPPADQVVKPIPARLDHNYKVDIADGPTMSWKYIADITISPPHYPILYGLPDDVATVSSISLDYDVTKPFAGCRYVPASSAKGTMQAKFQKTVDGPFMFPPTPPMLRFYAYIEQPVSGKLKCGDEDPVDFPILVGEFSGGHISIEKGAKWSRVGQGISDVAELNVACSLKTAEPVVNLFEIDEAPENIEINNSKSKAEVRDLARSVGFPDADRLQAMTHVDAKQINVRAVVEGKSAEYGPGGCFWVNRVTITLPRPVIYIPSEFVAGGCHYEALVPHERQHFEHFLTVLGHHIDVMNSPGGISSQMPTRGQPSYTIMSMSADTEKTLARVVSLAVNRIYWTTVEPQLVEVLLEYDEFDTQETLAKCQNWGP